jgi:hypothetical protein
MVRDTKRERGMNGRGTGGVGCGGRELEGLIEGAI